MTQRFRFAPSPTGLIHVGNLRTALFNWLMAHREGGEFLLRFDDTDAERSRSTFADAIAEDLAWLGIHPDETFRQSSRVALYEAAAERLRLAGRLYPCFETPEELDAKRQSQRRRGKPPIYDRAALKLSESDKESLIAAGRRPHWRLLLSGSDATDSGISWDDLFRGPQAIDLQSLSDPVLIREDGLFLYTLPSVVDDVDKGITHIIRGEDHVTNTAVQIDLFHALAVEPPVFGHHNLLTAASGEGLSKRTGARSIASLREAGYEPLAVATLAALIGTSATVEPKKDIEELAAEFSPAKVSRSPARFDLAELDSLNARLLHETPFAAVSRRLTDLGVGGDEPFWLAVRGNCGRLVDALGWWRTVTEEIEPPDLGSEKLLLDAAIALLPEGPWDEVTFGAWTKALKAETGLRGRALFMPLRLALTGFDHGPELAQLLPFIGRRDTLARLAAALRR
ncbi:MAG: glutamate--tRNA ligase [Alphaproteobacteria bacterium]